MKLLILVLILSFLCDGDAEKCPDHPRTVKPGDSVFLTIDDGPSFSSRSHLLKAFKEANVKVTFFESGYNLCNDLKSGRFCPLYAYEQNVKNLVQTVKDGHMLASHSDNHYYDTVKEKCTYLGIPPQIRPASRLAKCGDEPIQNMVQGAHQIQLALESKLAEWTSNEEIALKTKAIDDIWTYSRLPCSDIWRTRSSFSETNLPGVSDKKEITLRDSIADTMFSGEVTCRPDRYKGIPWENYGFDSDVDWKGATVLDKGEACRIVKLIEDNMESEKSPQKKGKLVLLTHDYFFDGKKKADVFKHVAEELVRKGYSLKTIDKFENISQMTPNPGTQNPTTNPTANPTEDPTEDPSPNPSTTVPNTNPPVTTIPSGSYMISPIFWIYSILVIATLFT